MTEYVATKAVRYDLIDVTLVKKDYWLCQSHSECKFQNDGCLESESALWESWQNCPRFRCMWI